MYLRCSVVVVVLVVLVMSVVYVQMVLVGGYLLIVIGDLGGLCDVWYDGNVVSVDVKMIIGFYWSEVQFGGLMVFLWLVVMGWQWLVVLVNVYDLQVWMVLVDGQVIGGLISVCEMDGSNFD